MKQTGTWIVSAVFVAAMLAIAVWIYPDLPPLAPTHWDAGGNVNGWMPRFWAAALPVLVLLGLAILTPLLPCISPRKFEITPFANVYGVLMLVIQGVLLVIFTCALLAGAGHQVPISLIAALSVGVLLMVIGNYMGKLRKNFFIGIRTPWTLASDVVWERTHRFAGPLFVAAGAAWIGLSFVRAQPGWMFVPVVAAAVLPGVYSYVVYRRLEGHR
jgi:uncharacterized membrane protein